MDKQASTPRVSCSHLNNYVGRVVMVVGKVTQLQSDNALLDADGHITVHLNREAQLVGGNAAQVIGKVQPDLSIKSLSTMDLGLDVDMNLSQKVVEAAQEYPILFGDSGGQH